MQCFDFSYTARLMLWQVNKLFFYILIKILIIFGKSVAVQDTYLGDQLKDTFWVKKSESCHLCDFFITKFFIIHTSKRIKYEKCYIYNIFTTLF